MLKRVVKSGVLPRIFGEALVTASVFKGRINIAETAGKQLSITAYRGLRGCRCDLPFLDGHYPVMREYGYAAQDVARAIDDILMAEEGDCIICLEDDGGLRFSQPSGHEVLICALPNTRYVCAGHSVARAMQAAADVLLGTAAEENGSSGTTSEENTANGHHKVACAR